MISSTVGQKKHSYGKERRKVTFVCQLWDDEYYCGMSVDSKQLDMWQEGDSHIVGSYTYVHISNMMCQYMVATYNKHAQAICKYMNLA